MSENMPIPLQLALIDLYEHASEGVIWGPRHSDEYVLGKWTPCLEAANSAPLFFTCQFNGFEIHLLMCVCSTNTCFKLPISTLPPNGTGVGLASCQWDVVEFLIVTCAYIHNNVVCTCNIYTFSLTHTTQKFYKVYWHSTCVPWWNKCKWGCSLKEGGTVAAGGQWQWL